MSIRLVAVLTLAIACSSPTVRRDPPVPHAEPGNCEASEPLPARCVSLADGQRLQGASRDRDECRFQAALAARELVPVEVTHRLVLETAGLITAHATEPEWTVRHEGGKQILVGPQGALTCDVDDAKFDFARNRDHELFFVMRDQHVKERLCRRCAAADKC